MFYVNARAFVERDSKQGTELVIQSRNKPGQEYLELPGGRIELYEPIYQALIREVEEETGLKVTRIEGASKRIDTTGINPDFEVEVVEPFCAHQTTKGPIDSIGMYFICKAEGKLLEAGDESLNPAWVNVKHIASMMEQNPLQFSDIDRAALMFYLKHRVVRD
ncbi:NUDIX domain-containing protein [Paenibacillus urinalis]|uniref:NUDIX domain-containing protein n=1 Tax=Paenibacillus urinalis TaxID=521520 RepID=A0AAX3N2M7_9BACL|nr:NUDIX domain-containing protein [Paenibacillus urinalis]WDH84111.1 NUDIX domain-containing protein [Paenibacillus urinalis]WDH95554.1 NUDIX domain-containing protein [Paenibacillus urinalis]WDI03751.1 NUDIX domain-containing protein [Paenibacillus urinalis]